MTSHPLGSPFTGESDAGLPEAGPDPDETALLLRRVRDGLLREPESSSDEGGAA